jgi:hypothetical protein
MFITLDMAKISTPFGDFKRTYDKNFRMMTRILNFIRDHQNGGLCSAGYQ